MPHLSAEPGVGFAQLPDSGGRGASRATMSDLQA